MALVSQLLPKISSGFSNLKNLKIFIMSFNFGTPKTATGFTLPTTSTITSTPSSGGSGDTKTQTKPLTNLFGTPTTTAATSTFGFSLGTPKTSTPTVSFGLAATTASATPTPGFTLTPATSTTTPQFSLSTSTPATTTTATSFTPIFGSGTSLSSATTTATTTPLKLTTSLTSASTATTSAPTLSLTSTPGLGLGAAATTTPAQATSTATTTTATTTAPTGSLTYAQLEDAINKWTIDLEEQGKFFINQAKQLNAWDNLLVSNSDKILALNETIERVKQQQKQLDQELDFILAQQNELDELSLPLEKQLADIPITDQNRFQTYQLSEIIDSQLKQMSEDLKEIVEHLNESNKNEDTTDPVIQVSKILNAHMNSLQWIDRNTAQISSHLEQISQLHETYKKNHLNM